MNKINFENAIFVEPAKVTIDGQDYNVTPAQFSNKNTPITADNLNNMQDNIEEAINSVVESGTWTPQLTNTGNDGEPFVTYDYQNGTYFKIGNMVVCFFRFRGKITSLGGSNLAGIKGFPYTVANNVAMGSLSSVYNLLTQYGGGELNSMPTIVVGGNNSIQIQSAESLGGTVAQFKLSGNESFECFGGFIYQTN